SFLRKLMAYVAEKVKFRGNISLVIVSDYQMRGLNKRFLNRNGTTDVISFDLRSNLPCNKNMILEDIDCEIIVNSERAVSVSNKYGLSCKEELALYCIHGLLHLAGYDDDTEENRDKMMKKQKKLLAGFFTESIDGKREEN
ncbi:MAG: rRNA maturation RNase YbeY, partial [Planctomycetota bacterium]